MNRGQVWVETVVYTLIGLSLIGLVLALVTPKINEYRDRTVIEQTVSSLNVIDATINDVLQAPGNSRIVDFRLKRGDVYFNASSEQIIYVLSDAHGAYSEPGVAIDIGRISVLTTPNGETYTTTLTLSYDIDLDYDQNSTIRHYSAAATPYRFSFTHAGFISNATSTTTVVRMRELSGA